MDYGALPPEINSARMYSGSGSTSMLAAAAAWDGLASELVSTASSYQSVITGLVSEGWLGPTSSSMAAAVAPYMTWMSMTGAKAEQAASQATAAAGAYEAAFAMTVPPAEVAANRTQLATLIATNFLGLNTPAIAANEAQYGEMWAQDAAAMYGYAASSAGASRLTSFGQPPQTTNPDAQNDQAEKVAQATSTSTASGAQETLSQLTSQVPNALQSFASPVSSSSASSSALTSTSLTSGSLWDFLNSNFLNGIVSGGYINPAIVEPAITASMADVNAVQLGAQPNHPGNPTHGLRLRERRVDAHQRSSGTRRRRLTGWRAAAWLERYTRHRQRLDFGRQQPGLNDRPVVGAADLDDGRPSGEPRRGGTAWRRLEQHPRSGDADSCGGARYAGNPGGQQRRQELRQRTALRIPGHRHAAPTGRGMKGRGTGLVGGDSRDDHWCAGTPTLLQLSGRKFDSRRSGCHHGSGMHLAR